MYLLGRNLTAIVKGIKGLAEGLLALQATIALGAFTRFAVLVGFRMAAQRTFHWGR